MVHGFTGAPKEMRGIGDYLKGHGITVIGIRLTGHATQMSGMVRTRWEDWLASVEDGINLLSDFCDQIFIAGLSMGGILALLAGIPVRYQWSNRNVHSVHNIQRLACQVRKANQFFSAIC